MPVNLRGADVLAREQEEAIAALRKPNITIAPVAPRSPLLGRGVTGADGIAVVYRACGDRYLLIEYGPPVLDIRLRFHVHALMLHLRTLRIPGILELTPGIRSLQVHYDPRQLPNTELLARLREAEQALGDSRETVLPARTTFR